MRAVVARLGNVTDRVTPEFRLRFRQPQLHTGNRKTPPAPQSVDGGTGGESVTNVIVPVHHLSPRGMMMNVELPAFIATGFKASTNNASTFGVSTCESTEDRYLGFNRIDTSPPL